MFREEDHEKLFNLTQMFETESYENEGSDNKLWPLFEQKKIEIKFPPILNTSLPCQDNQLSIRGNADLGSFTTGTRDFEEKRSPVDELIGTADPVEDNEVANADARNRFAVVDEHLIEEERSPDDQRIVIAAPEEDNELATADTRRFDALDETLEEVSQNQHNRESFPEKQPIILTSENKTTKHQIYKGSRSEELEGNQAEFVVNVANKIRKVRGKDYEMDLNEIDCTLQEDFSFYLNLRSYRSQEEYTMKGLKLTEDELHNIRNNITKYFTTEKFLATHNVGGATRKALKELGQPSEGPNRMKDSDVDRIWEVIGEDHQLIVNYFDDIIDNFLHKYLQNNFKTIKNSLKKSLKAGASLSNLSSANLARNLSDLVKNTFDSYVEELKLSQFRSENDQLSAELIDEIIEYVTVEIEAPQAIWFMGFRQAVKNQVFNYLKQKLCKLYVYGEKQDGAKKSRNEEKQHGAKKSKKVKKE